MINRGFVSPEFRQRVRGLAVPIALAMGRAGLTPNVLTLIGFAGTGVAGLLAASQSWIGAGVLLVAFGVFDLFDGTLARATGRASRFGAFLDSTVDRTGEGLVLAGVAFGCASTGFAAGAGLAATALVFASVVTYTRAKAEALGLHGEVGYAPRPERLVILSLGLVLAGLQGGVGLDPAPVVPLTEAPGGGWENGRPVLALSLATITALSAVTVVQRVLHVKRQLDQIDR